jgi:hypothetical protein
MMVLPLDQIINTNRRTPEVTGSFEGSGNTQLRSLQNNATRSAPLRGSRP